MSLFNVVPCVRKGGVDVWSGQANPVKVGHFDSTDQAEAWVRKQPGWRRV